MVLLEICVDSVESIHNAVLGGADRIELCSALSEGGLTPSIGLFHAAKKITSGTKTKISVMIRVRGGNFTYTENELSAMVEEVKYFKDNKADCIVFGALTKDLKIDIAACRRILEAWDKNKPATFHRAFDETKLEDLPENAKLVSSLGFKLLLTSGLEATAEAGIENIKTITKHAGEMKVMPGSGLNKDNVELIVRSTNCTDIHGSARNEKNIATRLSVGGTKIYVCDVEKVKAIIEILKKI